MKVIFSSSKKKKKIVIFFFSGMMWKNAKLYSEMRKNNWGTDRKTMIVTSSDQVI